MPLSSESVKPKNLISNKNDAFQRVDAITIRAKRLLVAVLHFQVLGLERALETLKGPLHRIVLVLPKLAQPRIGKKLAVDESKQFSEGSYEPWWNKISGV